MNKIKMQNEIRNSKIISFEIEGFEGETLKMKNRGLDFENNCLVSIDLDGESIEGTFHIAYETLCKLLQVEEFNFINVKGVK